MLEVAPINLPGEPKQRMLPIQLLIEPRSKQIFLTDAGLTAARLHSLFTHFARI